MHAGFRALRAAMPMNIRSQHPGQGCTPAAVADIRRIEALWRETRAQFGRHGPFLFGDFSAADAMYAPVVMRFNTYHPAVAQDTRDYCSAINAHPAVREWCAAAKLETEFEAQDEPYASPPG
jgi:glutathione S-transferase